MDLEYLGIMSLDPLEVKGRQYIKSVKPSYLMLMKTSKLYLGGQVTPDLMLKLTKEHNASTKPAKSKRPSAQQRRQQEYEDEVDASQAYPKPYYPGFLSALPGLQQTTDPKKDLVPIYKLLDETERMGEKLQKQEEKELEKVKQLAQELQDKQFRAPSQPIPCLSERESCLQCYRDNAKNPLGCADTVKVFKECSQRVHQNFAQRTTASS